METDAQSAMGLENVAGYRHHPQRPASQFYACQGPDKGGCGEFTIYLQRQLIAHHTF